MEVNRTDRQRLSRQPRGPRDREREAASATALVEGVPTAMQSLSPRALPRHDLLRGGDPSDGATSFTTCNTDVHVQGAHRVKPS
jgi:hypothetical protein